jgi:hypothetical protein
LRLLPGDTQPMTSEQESQLVGALAELLVERFEAHPGLLSAGLRSRAGSDLDAGPRSKEQQ